MARLWGIRKCKPHMNYDKLSRVCGEEGLGTLSCSPHCPSGALSPGGFPSISWGQNRMGSQRTGLCACSYHKYPLVSEGPKPWTSEPHRAGS